MQYTLFRTFFMLITVCTSIGAVVPSAIPNCPSDTISHASLDSLLLQYVNADGGVNYKGLCDKKHVLAGYCQRLSDHPPQENWSKEALMAYWINAYNANTLLLMVAHYPLNSILDLDNGKTWDVQRISIGNKKYSLNDLENKILRANFQDPRIHFAINCAARSCPPLWNHAFTAENIPSALENRTRAFVTNPLYNTLSAENAHVSKIFEWYRGDFGDLRLFLNRYGANLRSRAVVRFNAYDWALNAVP